MLSYGTPHPLVSLLTEGQNGWVEFVKHLVNTQRLNPTGESCTRTCHVINELS